MPVPDGLHTPITNIITSESPVVAPMVSPGSTGDGEVIALGNEDQVEPIPRPESFAEARMEIEIPDLPDIGIASFGAPPNFEAVIGTDERVQIQETEKYPWRVTASLLITAADNSQWIGTGWFISPRTLITAGHCVYIKHSGVAGRDGWVKKIQVMPGRNGNQLPFGLVNSGEFFTVTGWGENGLENYDYGAIILPNAFPQDLGFFGFAALSDEELLQSVGNIGGYPGDKPAGTLWYDNRKISNVNPEKVFYEIDTAGGQSGAVNYIIRDGERIGVAIHAYGGTTANSGTRISANVYTNLDAWKRS
ncbi:trypsin-like serine peptidase [Chitinophaga pinensis]|uniref:Serine protease n=1 Tax=Chitinophaga pinensis (strain ATCC 43595 / DSM 2588 / LMG 13176 / NBRC 15968 / NCIMB 11800 / UQM 2034) TaxID=485918 RepID=A0A979G533_CHIPD|nr:trypsin-like serine protease [Chitinophaga pinensis]ACU60942.1 V8-like Glu-specific endopeptidase-like protein [Chitinophaga pinensis DSM 2588]